MKRNRRETLALVWFIAAVFVVFAFAGLLREVPTVSIEQSMGRSNLRSFDFASIARITGHWEHFPDELLEPSALLDRTGQPTKSGARYGTYRMRISLPDDAEYVLGFVSVDYATRAFVNGALAQDIGTPGDTKESSVPRTAFVTLHARPSAGEIELVLWYSNFQHVSGGESNDVFIGTPALMDARAAHHSFYASLLIGCLLTAFLLLLGLYLFHPGVRANLYFALAALLLAARHGMVDERLFSTLLPNLPWHIAFAAQYLDLCLLSVTLVLFVDSFFPGVVHKAVSRIVYIASAAYALMVLLNDSSVYTRFLFYYQVGVQAFVILYIAVRLFIKFKSMAFDQRVSLVGMLVFFLGTLYDISFFNNIWYVFPAGVAQVSMVVFVFAQMLALFIRTEREVDEARRLEKQHAAKNAELTRLNRMKTQFLQDISHEMRTPLTIMSGYAHLTRWQLMEDAVTDQTLQNLKVVSSEAERLAQLVEQLLHVSIEKEQILSFERVNLLELLNRAAALCNSMIERNANTMAVQADEDIHVHINADMILQVLVNLITNANRHTRRGELRLCAEHGKMAKVMLADTGTGIAPELLPHVFERGVSGDGRSGLGLSICKEAVEVHGGQMHIESWLGIGTAVRFTLPIDHSQ